MATIYAGGSRRSANPTYTPFRPTTSVADNSLEQQLYQGIAANTPTTVAAPRLSEAIGAGTLTTTGSGNGNVSFGGTPGYAGLAGDARTIGGMTSALGSLSGNANLGQVGGIVGMAGALGGAKSPEQALGVMAGPALSLMGVPGGAVSLGKAALEGNTSLAINSIIGLANPTVGVLNGLASLFGLPTIGEVFAPKASATSPVSSGTTVGGGSTTSYGGNYSGFGLNGGFGESTGNGFGAGIGSSLGGGIGTGFGGSGGGSGNNNSGGANGRGFGGGNSGMGD